MKVLVFGTFDGLHEGHKDFFRQAREFGDYLTVVIGRDSTVERVKKRLPKFTELERQKAVQECGLVDEAVLGNEGSDPYKIIEQIKPDIICLGYDQTFFADKLAEELPKRGLEQVKVERLKAHKPEIFKSSLLNK
ncbi:MAG TPA: adenylyltransferase/cytidyltransferase family protein [Negativicutes bacterium]|nr:MAG: hypothetical protein A3A12_00940 [Candidatus Staskawiczbacteria bacterium RIFCSPLOWO2_01_FULL_43_17b]HLD70322.1 adenylyltransferase/cytidyltransferase family protein [Negativicutes bacterium]